MKNYLVLLLVLVVISRAVDEVIFPDWGDYSNDFHTYAGFLETETV